MALAAMVGTECVTGNIMPMTPQGARSMMHNPVLSLRAWLPSLRMASTPCTKRMLVNFRIL